MAAALLGDSATSPCILVCSQRIGWGWSRKLMSWGWENNSVGKVLVMKV